MSSNYRFPSSSHALVQLVTAPVNPVVSYFSMADIGTKILAHRSHGAVAGPQHPGPGSSCAVAPKDVTPPVDPRVRRKTEVRHKARKKGLEPRSFVSVGERPVKNQTAPY